MTRKRARELLPVISAYAEGKEIQINNPSCGWSDLKECSDPSFGSDYPYRIKPTPKLRPFRRGEIKCGDVVKNKNSQATHLVCSVCESEILAGMTWITFEALLGYYTMADGSPCGKEEEVCSQ